MQKPKENAGLSDEATTAINPRAAGPFALAGAALLGGGFVLGLLQRDHLAYFLHSYLVSVCFVASLCLGALFFVAVLHATRAGWGIVLRRIAEFLSVNIATVAVLFLPVLVAVIMRNHWLYEWLDAERMREGSKHYSELLAIKRPYFQVYFYVARSVGYFVIWWALARFFFTRSLKQDESGDPNLTLQMERWSGPSLLLFAVSLTFAAFDWLMSLTPEWYSTIFGLYFFAGCVVSGLSSIVLSAVMLQATGRLKSVITPEHYHDMGKLLLGFVIFWGYMGFSQYMLIWYGNIPEETVWYQARQTNGWALISLALLFGHLLIPFFGLLSREVKRRRHLLAFWAVWLLVFHWIDLYWVVMPSLEQKKPQFGLLDVAVALGILSLYLAGLALVAGGKSLVARKDPRLGESLAFENY
jgi:hypothetical protein